MSKWAIYDRRGKGVRTPGPAADTLRIENSPAPSGSTDLSPARPGVGMLVTPGSGLVVSKVQMVMQRTGNGPAQCQVQLYANLAGSVGGLVKASQWIPGLSLPGSYYWVTYQFEPTDWPGGLARWLCVFVQGGDGGNYATVIRGGASVSLQTCTDGLTWHFYSTSASLLHRVWGWNL